MKHLPLDTADLAAIGIWIENGAHLFPYQNKHPMWKWRDEWIRSPAEAKQLSDDRQWNIAFDIESAGACMIDIDCLLPLKADEMHDLYGQCLADDPELKLHKFIDAYKACKKDEFKKLGKAKCRRMLDMVVAEALQDMPPHNHQPSSSGFGHHLYYRVDIPDDAKRAYPSSNIEIFANPHPAYPVKWSDLHDFFSNDPVPYDDVVKYWQDTYGALDECSVLREQYVKTIPAPQINVSANGRVVDYDYEAYLDRCGYGTDLMNNRLNAWIFRAGQLGDHDQKDIAAAEAAAHGHAANRIRSTINSAWNAGIAQPLQEVTRQREMISGFQSKIRSKS